MLNISIKLTRNTKLFLTKTEYTEIVNQLFEVIKKNVDRRSIKIENYERKR